MYKKLSRNVLTDEIYTLIKEKILTHNIAPGVKINIDQLARNLEVSNIPIREALSRLSAEGLVETIPYKGMYVANLSLQELDEMLEIRMELECLALRKAVSQIPEQLLDQLHRDMQAWKQLTHEHNEDRIQLIAEMNERLHGLILQYCHNHSLQSLIHTYIEKIQRYWVLSQAYVDPVALQYEWEEHMKIIQALIHRDSSAAAQALQEHLQKSYVRTREVF